MMDINILLAKEQVSLIRARFAMQAADRSRHLIDASLYARHLIDGPYPHRGVAAELLT